MVQIRRFKIFGRKVQTTEEYHIYEYKEAIIVDKESYIIATGKTIVFRNKTNHF